MEPCRIPVTTCNTLQFGCSNSCSTWRFQIGALVAESPGTWLLLVFGWLGHSAIEYDGQAAGVPPVFRAGGCFSAVCGDEAKSRWVTCRMSVGKKMKKTQGHVTHVMCDMPKRDTDMIWHDHRDGVPHGLIQS